MQTDSVTISCDDCCDDLGLPMVVSGRFLRPDFAVLGRVDSGS